MTDPVILLGTQSNGETLPVQVDGFGRLVAEGLQGSEGPPGPEGPQGPQGPAGEIDLPPDPYEGALLGWLDGGLAWVGSPPVPIPPGVFGPITAWDAQSGLLTVEGEIPASVLNGVYIWQCEADGTHFTEGWNTSENWTDLLTTSPIPVSNTPEFLFDGNLGTEFQAYPVENNQVVLGLSELFPSSGGPYTVTAWAWDRRGVSVNNGLNRVTAPNIGRANELICDPVQSLTSIELHPEIPEGTILHFGVAVNGALLVDNVQSLNLRVNSVLGQSLLGVPSATVDFTIGKYLRVPEQRVAPWVLYGNDPTSLIDHLRSS